MDLKQFIKDHRPSDDLVHETDMGEGLFISISFIDADILAAYRKKASRLKWAPNHMSYHEVDEEALNKLLAEHIRGWRGLTLRRLSRIIGLKISHLPEEKKDQVVDYSPDNAIAMVQGSKTIRNLIFGIANDTDFFRTELEGPEKNLPAGSSGGPSQEESPVASA